MRKCEHKMKRILILFSILVFGVYLVGCENGIKRNNCKEKEYNYALTEILVMVKSEYKDKFLNKEFTISNFQYENVKSFKYGTFFEKSGQGMLVIYLKRPGAEEVEDALKHFEKLGFVENAEKNAFVYMC